MQLYLDHGYGEGCCLPAARLRASEDVSPRQRERHGLRLDGRGRRVAVEHNVLGDAGGQALGEGWEGWERGRDDTS